MKIGDRVLIDIFSAAKISHIDSYSSRAVEGVIEELHDNEAIVKFSDNNLVKLRTNSLMRIGS